MSSQGIGVTQKNPHSTVPTDSNGRISSTPIHAGSVDVKDPRIDLNSDDSPREAIFPMRSAILKGAASAGAVFVSHCPDEDK